MFAIAIPVLVLAVTVQSSQLKPEEKRGKQIYLRGVSPSGRDITALVGKEGVEVPATTLSCANCHGQNGRGKPEGGLKPSNITWDALTRPSGVAAPAGRRRSPYNESTLKRAITMGIDSAGNHLHAAMPRYRLSQQDIADLVAYIRMVDRNPDPGVTETTIRLGAILPSSGSLTEAGRAVRSALTAWFDEANRQGGINGRQIELRFLEPPADSKERAKAIRDFIEAEEIFALAASFIGGADTEIAAVLQEDEAPLVGAFTLYPRIGTPANRYVFYLYSGINEQARVLATYAAQKYGTRSTGAIVSSDEAFSRDAAAALKSRATQLGWKTLEEVTVSRGEQTSVSLVQKLREKGTDLIFWLGDDRAARVLLEEGRKLDWKPKVFIPGSLASSDVFAAAARFGGRLFFSLPTLPTDQTAEALASYRKLAAASTLPTAHMATQLAALSSAAILLEGIKRAGQDLSREKLVTGLEGLYEFRTGLTPAVTFGPNRRVGATGAYVLAVAPGGTNAITAAEWVDAK